MDPTVAVGLVSLLAAVLVPVIAKILAGKKDSAAEGRLNHDELQEDLAALREEFRLYKREITAQVNYQGRVIRHLDDEVIQLRQGIEAGMVPPLPPRPPWPTDIGHGDRI